MSDASDDLRLVWVDLEMTGLNPANDAIIEIAVVVTGADLVPLVEIERSVSAPDEFLDRMSDRVRRMHTENGLLDSIAANGVSLREAERAVVNAIADHVPAGEGILSGNSVFHDLRFIAKHMPRLEQHLHFRQIDIGTISALVNAWYPSIQYPYGPVNHRAMADVKASLEELRYYCTHALNVDLAKVARARGR